MDGTYWEEAWRQGRLGFHREAPNPHLVRFAERFLPAPPASVLLPLAGKSVDLVWLARKGYEAWGVEIVAHAIEIFHGEHGLEPVVEEREGGVRLFRSPGLRMLEGDFFTIPAEVLGRHDAVFDRAAFVAVLPERRGEYATRLREVLHPRGRILLVTMDYDRRVMSGPPFSVEEGEVERHFASRFDIEVLKRREAVDDTPSFRRAGLESMIETVHLLSAR